MLKVIVVMPLGEPRMPTLDALPAMIADRLENRRSILQQLDLKFERVRAGKAIERLEKF